MKRIAQWVALWLAIISVLVFMTILSTLITFPVYAHMDDLPQIAVMSLGRLLSELFAADGLLKFTVGWYSAYE